MIEICKAKNKMQGRWRPGITKMKAYMDINFTAYGKNVINENTYVGKRMRKVSTRI